MSVSMLQRKLLASLPKLYNSRIPHRILNGWFYIFDRPASQLSTNSMINEQPPLSVPDEIETADIPPLCQDRCRLAYPQFESGYKRRACLNARRRIDRSPFRTGCLDQADFQSLGTRQHAFARRLPRRHRMERRHRHRPVWLGHIG